MEPFVAVLFFLLLPYRGEQSHHLKWLIKRILDGLRDDEDDRWFPAIKAARRRLIRSCRCGRILAAKERMCVWCVYITWAPQDAEFRSEAWSTELRLKNPGFLALLAVHCDLAHMQRYVQGDLRCLPARCRDIVLTSGMDVRSEPSHRNRIFCQAATTLPCTQSCQGLSKSSLGWISPAIKLYYLKIIQPRLCKCRFISPKQATISTTFTRHIKAMKRACSLAICLRVK